LLRRRGGGRLILSLTHTEHYAAASVILTGAAT
jgi:phosphopantetheinyl transferase (holo-ACP synthase)